MKDYNRVCIGCDGVITYKSKSQYNEANKHNRVCRSCANKRRSVNPKPLIKECIKCGYSHTFSTHSKYIQSKPLNEYKCKSCASVDAHTGKSVTAKSKKAIGIAVKNAWASGSYLNAVKKSSDRWAGKNNPMYNSNRCGKLNPFYGKTHTVENITYFKNRIINDSTHNKMRESAINRISKAKFNGNQMIPGYNTSSIPIIEAKAKELGITDLQHAENGGEYMVLGYFVDGYSKEKNIVIEYDEKHHNRQIDKDLKRQNEIENYLKCKFIRIVQI